MAPAAGVVAHAPMAKVRRREILDAGGATMRWIHVMAAIPIGTLLFAEPVGATEVRYDCADGTRLTATFSAPGDGPGSARLSFSDTSSVITLPQVLSADGGRYADGPTEFWIKGNGARLTRAGVTTTCSHETATLKPTPRPGILSSQT
jgi:membrane-bound inhibitor of C-type lysozyme